MGALIVLAVLAIAGLYVPRSHKAQADTPELAPSTSVTPNPEKLSPNSAHPNQPVPSGPPGAEFRFNARARPIAPGACGFVLCKTNWSCPKKLTAQNRGAAGESGARPRIDAGPTSQAAPADSAQLDELELAVDQLSTRAEAVNNSLDRLQQQQNAAGFGLRGDMAARQASMKANLSRAEEAIQHGDLARTKKYLDLAGRDVEVLERFLGF